MITNNFNKELRSISDALRDLGYVQFQNPEMLLHCQRILAIPMKETEKRFVEYLPERVLKELLSLPDQTKKYGIRDTALLCLLYDSGARVQELIDLSLLGNL